MFHIYVILNTENNVDNLMMTLQSPLIKRESNPLCEPHMPRNDSKLFQFVPKVRKVAHCSPQLFLVKDPTIFIISKSLVYGPSDVGLQSTFQLSNGNKKAHTLVTNKCVSFFNTLNAYSFWIEMNFTAFIKTQKIKM